MLAIFLGVEERKLSVFSFFLFLNYYFFFLEQMTSVSGKKRNEKKKGIEALVFFNCEVWKYKICFWKCSSCALHMKIMKILSINGHRYWWCNVLICLGTKLLKKLLSSYIPNVIFSKNYRKYILIDLIWFILLKLNIKLIWLNCK